jgi:hypothetical protein
MRESMFLIYLGYHLRGSDGRDLSAIPREAMSKSIPSNPLGYKWFDRLTTNGIKHLPFILSLSKDVFSGSLGKRETVSFLSCDSWFNSRI